MKYINNTAFWKEDTNTLATGQELQSLFEIVKQMSKNLSKMIWR